jgi:excisionase family DNA binding protein
MDRLECQIQEIKGLILESNLLRKEVLNVSEAAVYMDLSKPTLYKLTSEHKITFYKPSGKVYFKRADCDRFMLSNKQTSTQELESNAAHFLTTRERMAV